MNRPWIAAVLLLTLSLSSNTLMELSPDCKEKESPSSIQHVKINSSVWVHCPNVDAVETAFTLSHNRHKLSYSKVNRTKAVIQDCTERRVEFQVNKHNQTTFILPHVQVNSTGLYTCLAEVLYPPPYQYGEKRTVVLVEELQCPLQKKCIGATNNPNAHWVWWAMGCGVLLCYSLVCTGLTVVLWHKLRTKQCSQGDYMNMKPRGFKRHQGVQHPVRTGRY